MTAPLDPITTDLVGHALGSIADEMALTIVRTAHSSNLTNSMDLSSALCNAKGRLIVQGLLFRFTWDRYPIAWMPFSGDLAMTFSRATCTSSTIHTMAGRICPTYISFSPCLRRHGCLAMPRALPTTPISAERSLAVMAATQPRFIRKDFGFPRPGCSTAVGGIPGLKRCLREMSEFRIRCSAIYGLRSPPAMWDKRGCLSSPRSTGSMRWTVILKKS